MKHLMTLIATALALTVGAAHADDKAHTPQQNKMAHCNKEAGDRKGDERKHFMSQCLSNKPAAAPAHPMTQQERMKHCNADAKDKKGDERKHFMSECLKAK